MVGAGRVRVVVQGVWPAVWIAELWRGGVSWLGKNLARARKRGVWANLRF